jgi:hypothetical protein
MQMLKVPQWLAARREVDDMDNDYTVPPIATLPQPMREPETDEEKRLAAIAQAHVYVEQMRQERAATLQQNEQLKTDLKSEQRKSGLLGLDVAERDNTISTLQSENLGLRATIDKFRQFLSVKNKSMRRRGRHIFNLKSRTRRKRNARQAEKGRPARARSTAQADG